MRILLVNATTPEADFMLDCFPESTIICAGEKMGQCVIGDNVPDLLFFGGGPDVSPHLYDAYNIDPNTSAYYALDAKCVYWWTFAHARMIPCFGICRGMQFLVAMSGGILEQHISNHLSGDDAHAIKTPCGLTIPVLKDHHQYAELSDLLDLGIKVGATDSRVNSMVMEASGIEWAGVQYHPEWSKPSSDAWKRAKKLAQALVN